MSSFIIDAQTFRDLNIFSGPGESGSVFNMFKNTRTMGGRERLKAMMSNPESSIELIRTRSECIRYFHRNKIIFDINNEELDLISFYLKSDKKKLKDNLIDAAWDYLSRHSSNDYYIATTGLKYLIKLARLLLRFIDGQLAAVKPDYLNVLFERITGIIDQGLLKDSLHTSENKLTFYQVSRFDKAFRGAEKQHLYELLELVYEIDALKCIALVAAERNFCFPEYIEGTDMSVSVKGLFHPGIRNAVSNDIDFGFQQNIVFLTGSNMAGKSSLLKSIGIAIYMAHLGFPVPASAMKTTLFSGLVSTINLPDNLGDGLSHYYSEVKRVKEVAEKLVDHERMFVIFDELFRGTNVKDAFDASLLIISELSKIKNSAFFISTHIVELADELKKLDNIAFRHMETFFDGHKPLFTYQLAEGISKERLGMYIVLNEGIVEIIRQAAGQY